MEIGVECMLDSQPIDKENEVRTQNVRELKGPNKKPVRLWNDGVWHWL